MLLMAKARQKKAASPSESLRAAILKSGLSLSEIARRAGIDGSQVIRFIERKRTLTLPAVDALAEVLGLSLTRTVRRKRTRGGRKGR